MNAQEKMARREYYRTPNFISLPEMIRWYTVNVPETMAQRYLSAERAHNAQAQQAAHEAICDHIGIARSTPRD